MEIQQEFKVTGAGAQWASANWGPGGLPVCRNGGRGPAGIRQLGSGGPRPGNGRTLRSPTGEVEVLEFQNGSANVLISSERMSLLQELLCKSHFEATVAHFEFGRKFRRNSK